MNICLIGNFSGNPDEGMKVVARCLAQKLAKTHDVLKLDIYKAIRPSVWHGMLRFNPNVLHYISGPSPFSFMMLRVLLLGCKVRPSGYVKTVMTATQPWLPLNSVSFCRKLKPDLLLTQSRQTEKYFKHVGFFVRNLPNGVDTDRFKPVTESGKSELRAKYGLSDSDFIVLHVGPVRMNRGLDVLKPVAQMKHCRVLVAGSTTSPLEEPMFLDLVKSGCVVWREYIKRIHEVYQLSDLYVFPVEDRLGSIDIPLSVLEAMACNLPVITTRFGGFPRLFTKGDGFFFVNHRHKIPEVVEDLRSRGISHDVRTRSKVMPFSWENIAKTLIRYYMELLD